MKKLNFRYIFLIGIIGLFMISCSKEGDMDNDLKSPSSGKGGSTARITIVGNYLYAVDNTSLKVVNITNPSNPVYVKTINIGFGIETIYPFNNYLFIGSNSGMFIYSLANPETPVQLSEFEHITSCDPVIANDSLAFVTLRSTEVCRRWQNTRQIEVIDVKNVLNPLLINTYFTADAPYGLDMNDDYLFVCHGSAGFAIYNKNNVISGSGSALLKTVTGINAFDAVLYNNILFIIGESGFYQYDYSNINNPVLMSSITAGN